MSKADAFGESDEFERIVAWWLLVPGVYTEGPMKGLPAEKPTVGEYFHLEACKKKAAKWRSGYKNKQGSLLSTAPYLIGSGLFCLFNDSGECDLHATELGVHVREHLARCF
jgi:hypothetical protein